MMYFAGLIAWGNLMAVSKWVINFIDIGSEVGTAEHMMVFLGFLIFYFVRSAYAFVRIDAIT